MNLRPCFLQNSVGRPTHCNVQRLYRGFGKIPRDGMYRTIIYTRHSYTHCWAFALVSPLLCRENCSLEFRPGGCAILHVTRRDIRVSASARQQQQRNTFVMHSTCGTNIYTKLHTTREGTYVSGSRDRLGKRLYQATERMAGGVSAALLIWNHVIIGRTRATYEREAAFSAKLFSERRSSLLSPKWSECYYYYSYFCSY